MPETKELPLALIKRDPELQTRAVFNAGVAKEYGDEISEGKTFPPLIVFQEGKTFWLAEGFHRADGYEKAGIGEALCTIHKGTKRDALKHALGSNADHGLRRTAADKRKAVEIALKDEEWGKLSVRAIAELCNVHHTVVTKVQKEREAAGATPRETVTTANGRTQNSHHESSARARTAPVEREPGDESENEEPTVAVAEPATQPRASVAAYFDSKPSSAVKKTHFDDSQHGKLFGPLVRFYSSRAQVKGCVNGKHHSRLKDLTQQVLDCFEEWQREVA